ncbi:olfactory receptor 10A7-like [Leptodactylus fuscus]|uniref:olfactory receptor 10A7-like n=1 Tax=Leptodactylus fuscus TaxID=238119 RepID=UPI003F4E4D6C
MTHKDASQAQVMFGTSPSRPKTFGSLGEENNKTMAVTFFLIGFQVKRGFRLSLLCLFLMVYCLTICGNLLFITLVSTRLGEPSISTHRLLHIPVFYVITEDSSNCIPIKQRIIRDEDSVEFCHFFYENNKTEVTNFFLLGFQGSQDVRQFLFCLFLVLYCGTICGNLLIITLVSTSKILHTPMYFFISQLSTCDILLTISIVPNLLHILLNNGAMVTFIGCILQLYFFGTSDVFECFLLAVMSYDRYVAICNPLRYSSIMTNETCVILIVICWVAGFSIILIYIIATIKLDYCGPNIIDHVFCDIVPLLELACSDTFIIHLEMYLIGILTIFIPSTIIVVSYTSIIRAVLRIPSSTGRQKVFSTCSSHLIVVSIFFWTIFSVYIVPTKGQTSTMSKILSLLYTVFTSLVNPIIYSLRNKDIRKAIKETIDKHVIW